MFIAKDLIILYPLFQHSSIPGHLSKAKPVISEPAQRTRFSVLE